MTFDKAMEILISAKTQNKIDEIYGEAALFLNEFEWENFLLFVNLQEIAIKQ